jgi:hypothetical protein
LETTTVPSRTTMAVESAVTSPMRSVPRMAAIAVGVITSTLDGEVISLRIALKKPQAIARRLKRVC